MLPKIIAFDLDYTLWDLWIDTHVTPPLTSSDDTGAVVDAHGTEIDFYPDVRAILRRLRADGVFVAACSRTHAPDLAIRALNLLRVPESDEEDGIEPGMSAIEYFDDLQIYPGSKLAHFRAIHKKTGIPYEQMLFFDDESRNREVERLGVVFHYTPQGVSHDVLAAGLKSWTKRVIGN